MFARTAILATKAAKPRSGLRYVTRGGIERACAAHHRLHFHPSLRGPPDAVCARTAGDGRTAASASAATGCGRKCSGTAMSLGQIRSVLAGRASRYTTLQSSAAAVGMRLFVGAVERNGPEIPGETTSSRRVMTTELKISEEPLADRVLRQVRSGILDEARLLPSAEKRARDVAKKLDRLVARQGWYTFMAGQAHAVATGKAPAKRNAEIMAVEQVARWRSEVSSFRAGTGSRSSTS